MENEYKHKFAAIILAAGKGTRMKSRLPKVMHKLAGKPLVAHVLDTLKPMKPEKTVLVIAPGMESVKEAALKVLPDCKFVEQKEQLGTGHAVRCAQEALKGYTGTVIVLYADTPMITAPTLQKALDAATSAEVVVLGMQLDEPQGYGRLIVDNSGQIEEIIEEKDATPEQKKIALCNSGVMTFSGKYLFELLKNLEPHNVAGEYYLTDAVAAADNKNLHCRIVEVNALELAGINSRAQLAEAERVVQKRLRRKAMDNGAMLIDPKTVYFSMDTKLGQDVVVHPNVVFGPEVTVENNVEIRSFSHIEGAFIDSGAVIGPFARLRPGARIGQDAHVGNFVELKQTTLGKGAKANHLSYVGDSEVGEGANIGAGTITCNYDGNHKYKTVIGKNAFIGSNSSLVAPVTIGEGAIIGAGSVITKNVESNALALERSQQVNKSGKAEQLKSRPKKQ